LKSVFVKGEISNFKHHYTRPYVFYFERWKFVDKMHNV
jgi:exonuclease VII large subunit